MLEKQKLEAAEIHKQKLVEAEKLRTEEANKFNEALKKQQEELNSKHQTEMRQLIDKLQESGKETGKREGELVSVKAMLEDTKKNAERYSKYLLFEF